MVIHSVAQLEDAYFAHARVGMSAAFQCDTATGNYSVHRTDLGIRNTKRHVELGRRTCTCRDATVDQPAAHRPGFNGEEHRGNDYGEPTFDDYLHGQRGSPGSDESNRREASGRTRRTNEGEGEDRSTRFQT